MLKHINKVTPSLLHFVFPRQRPTAPGTSPVARSTLPKNKEIHNLKRNKTRATIRNPPSCAYLSIFYFHVGWVLVFASLHVRWGKHNHSRANCTCVSDVLSSVSTKPIMFCSGIRPRVPTSAFSLPGRRQNQNPGRSIEPRPKRDRRSLLDPRWYGGVNFCQRGLLRSLLCVTSTDPRFLLLMSFSHERCRPTLYYLAPIVRVVAGLFPVACDRKRLDISVGARNVSASPDPWVPVPPKFPSFDGGLSSLLTGAGAWRSSEL